MNILLFAIFLNTVFLLIIYFSSEERKTNLKVLIYCGIFIGSTSVGFTFLIDSSFGGSTPIDIKTKNLTQQNLKIYAISFWDNFGSGSGNYVNFNKELEPNESSKFCFDSDGGKFWLVAKNKDDEIVYIEETQNEKTDFKIIPNLNIQIDKVQIAQELIFKKDKTVESEKYLLWTNILLIGLLAVSSLKR